MKNEDISGVFESLATSITNRFEKLSLLLWIFKILKFGKRAFSSFIALILIHQDSHID
jgi:hypothetical protein